MRCPLFLLIASLVSVAGPARAEIMIDASFGYGIEASPKPGNHQDPNIMVATGWGINELVVAKLGLVGSYSGSKDTPRKGELQIRPMLVMSTPLFPLYLRATLALKDPFSDSRRLAYGASMGIRFSLMGLRAFAEIGALAISAAPIDADMINVDPVRSMAEGRMGVSLPF